MATVTNWSPYGVALNITATGGTVTRISATQYTVKINVSWQTYWSGNSTNYGMKASAGGGSVTLNPSGTYSSGNSGSFTGTFSVSGYGASTQTITVAFTNFTTDWQGNVTSSSSKNVSFSVSVPAVQSYTVYYDANGGTGAPSSQSKYKDQSLTISSTTPSRTGYLFQGWATSSNGGVAYNSGSTYSANANITLYAVWKAKTVDVYFYSNTSDNFNLTNIYTYGKSGQCFINPSWSREGYSQIGWSTSSSATTAEYSVTNQVSDAWIEENSGKSIALFAVWQQNGAYLDINIHYGDIVYASGSTLMTENEAKSILSVTIYVNDVTVASNVCDYCTIHTVGSSYQVTWTLWNSNYTVYKTERLSGVINNSRNNVEIYVGKNHTVTYNANGGYGAPNSQTKKYGSLLTLSSVEPTKDGFSFVGWSTSKDSRKVSYTPSGKYNSELDITLYAVWVENYILFKPDGSLEVVEIIEDDLTTPSTVLFSKNGILTVNEVIESDSWTIISPNRGLITKEIIERQ